MRQRGQTYAKLIVKPWQGKKDERRLQDTQEAKIISGKDHQMLSPSVEKQHRVFKVLREG